MDIRGLLDQLLGAGRSALDGTGLTGPDGGISDFGRGAATGGALGLLLGSKTGRRLAAYGGIAALGLMAWRAYAGKRNGPDSADDGIPAEHAAQASRAVLRAMLAAARVDGHIDGRERGLIDQEIARLGGDKRLRAWVDAELTGPLDPQSIAGEAAGNVLLASEIYLATALVIGEPGFLERAYLDRLGSCLDLDADLRQRLERQAQATNTLPAVQSSSVRLADRG